MKHETLESESSPVRYLKDLGSGNEVLIVVGETAHLYRTRDSSLNTSRIPELKNSMLCLSFSIVTTASEFFLVLGFDLSILLFDVPEFRSVSKKRLEINEQFANTGAALKFFDSDSERLYFSLNEKCLVFINKSDLLSRSPLAKLNLIYNAHYRIEKAFCLRPDAGLFCLARRDSMQGVFTFEVINSNTFRRRKGHFCDEKILQDYTGTLNCEAPKELGTLIDVIASEAPKTVLFLFSRGVLIFSDKVYIFKNQTNENFDRDSVLGSLVPGAHLVQGENGLRLSMYCAKGEIASTFINLQKPKKPLQWHRATLRSFLGISLHTISHYKCLNHSQVVLLSKSEGILFADYQKKRRIHTSPYTQHTYLDALTLDPDYAQIITVLACGGFCSTLGFVSLLRKSLSANSFQIIDVKQLGDFGAIRNFWFTYKGIVPASCIRNSDNSLLHVSFYNRILTTRSAKCALQLKNSVDEYLMIDSEHDLYLVNEKTALNISSLAGLSSWNVCHMSAIQTNDHPSTLLIALSDGRDVHMLENGVLVATHSFKGANISEVCLKDCSSSIGVVLIVTNHTGCITILKYSFESRLLSLYFEVRLGESRAFRLCNIEKVDTDTTKPQDPIVFVYNSSGVFILNLSRRSYYTWSLDFDVKLIKYQGNNRYVVLTMDDNFVTLAYNGVHSTEWARKELVSRDWVFTKMIQLKNSRFVLLVSQTTNFKSKVSIFDVKSFQIIDEHILPDQGVIRGILALEKPYTQEVIISFGGCSPNSDCLIVLSVLGSKLFKTGIYKIKGTSAALAQSGDTIVHTGEKTVIFKLQKCPDRRTWEFKLLMKPFEGSGPRSLDCTFISGETLCVLDELKGICFYDLATKKRISKYPIQNYELDVVHRRENFGFPFLKLMKGTEISETFKDIGSRTADIDPLLNPVKKTETHPFLFVACDSQLLIYSCHPLYLKNSQTNSKLCLLCANFHLPFEGTVTSMRQTHANQFLICTPGRLELISLDAE
ncbi:LAQU0S02e09516g1_1 [Lachancea quebecensis]|uniref:LAQU0S02e09516g1_1 n=1 Tax=Lachancea quebecensis TaxID=1654605 RepID=A0A0P1KNU9_9SACH|nr:LAQU0S02e09516g1_1 [Lachancea quebecensis]